MVISNLGSLPGVGFGSAIGPGGGKAGPGAATSVSKGKEGGFNYSFGSTAQGFGPGSIGIGGVGGPGGFCPLLPGHQWLDDVYDHQFEMGKKRYS
jgi:hypothetical protein